MVTVDNVLFGNREDAYDAIVFSGYRNALAAINRQGAMSVWDVENNRRWHLAWPTEDDSRPIATCLAASTTGGRIACGYENGQIHVIDLPAQKIYGMQYSPKKRISSLAISRDGRLLASAAKNGAVIIWKLDNCQELLSVPFDFVQSMVFHPKDDALLTACGKTGNIGRIDVKNGVLRALAENPPEPLFNLALTPDGMTLAGTSDGMVEFWEIPRQKRKIALKPNNSSLRASCFVISPDGKMVAVGTAGHVGEIGCVELWKIPGPVFVGSFAPHLGGVARMSWSADGKMLATIGYRGRGIRVWNVGAMPTP